MTTITIKPKTATPLAQYLTLTEDEFMAYRTKDVNGENPIHMHEVMKSKITPLLDFDFKCLTEAEFSNNAKVLNAAKQQVAEHFPAAKYPNVKIIDLVSSGPTSWKVKVPMKKKVKDGWKNYEENVVTDGWKISAHFLIQGVGQMTPMEIAEIVSRFHVLKAAWDLDIYSEGHTVRLPYCTKEGERRFLQRADISNGQVKLYSEVDAMKHFKETYTDWIMTDFNAAPQPKAKKVKKVKKVESDDESESDSESDEDEDDNAGKKWSKWTFDEAKEVIKRLKSDRAASHKARIKGIMAIIHLARAVKPIKAFKPLAHLFAKNDPEYDKDQVDRDWDGLKKPKACDKPITFASVIGWANEDSPEVVEVIGEDEDIPLTFYDQIHVLLAKKPKLIAVQKYLMGCLRYCCKKGAEQWFQHSTDGWYQIDNAKNFPFGSYSSNVIFKDTDLFEITLNLKDTEQFKKRCITDGAVFYPWYAKNDRPDIINLFRGWPMTRKRNQNLEMTRGVEIFKSHVMRLFGAEPGEYVLNTLTRKLLFPRLKSKLILAYDKLGGAGKNAFEAILRAIFGTMHTLSSNGTAQILGQGEAAYNALAEFCLIAFIQEAKEKGQSIVCDDKFKNWLSEDIQQIRRMRENPRDAPNYGSAFLWSNNPNCLKLTPAMARRVMAVEVGYDMVDITKPEVAAYFDELWGLLKDPEALQDIFDWLLSRDISKFNIDIMPQTAFKDEMIADSMTYVQKYMIEVCNGTRSVVFNSKGVGKVHGDALFEDYRTWCSNELRLADKFALTQDHFRKELTSKLDIPYKKIKIGTNPCYGHRICIAELQDVMRKLLKNNTWKLIRNDEEPETEDDDA